MKRTSSLLSICSVVALAALVVSCQQIFTYSPLKNIPGLVPSPKDMTPAQQVSYGEQALASGDSTAMKTAFDALQQTLANTANPSPQTQVLAAQLAFGGSGATAVVNQLLGAVASGGASPDLATLQTTVQTALAGVDTSTAAAGAQLLLAATSNPSLPAGSITDAQLATGAAALIVSAAAQPGVGFQNLASVTAASNPTAYQALQDAATLAGHIQSAPADLTQLLGSVGVTA